MDYVLKRLVEYNATADALKFTAHALFTRKGVLISHLRYLYRHRNKSQSWLERSALAIELLMKFIHANAPLEPKATLLLSQFVDALNFGTIDKHGYDKSGLYWHPRQIEDTNVLLSHINSYCDFLDQQHGTDLPNLNPLRMASKAEERMLWCAYYRRKANCFLNHLKQPDPVQLSYVREIQSKSRPLIADERISRFPDELFSKLLEFGFRKRNGTPDYSSILILMLMHFGGLRLSECFHIFINDVSIDRKTGSSIVRVFHPSAGESPDEIFRTRRELLNIKYQLKPRNEYHRNHKMYAGWKSPLLTNKNLSFEVFFCPSEQAQLFTRILQRYLETTRRNNHPFLLCNQDGDPETKKNFIKKYNTALKRIAVNPCKFNGTSPHGHRHSYGYRLAQMGLSPTDIQKAMHHKSPNSSHIYTQPSDSEIREKMRGNA